MVRAHFNVLFYIIYIVAVLNRSFSLHYLHCSCVKSITSGDVISYSMPRVKLVTNLQPGKMKSRRGAQVSFGSARQPAQEPPAICCLRQRRRGGGSLCRGVGRQSHRLGERRARNPCPVQALFSPLTGRRQLLRKN